MKLVAFLLFFLSSHLIADPVDHYLALGIPIPDQTHKLNTYYNQEVRTFLAQQALEDKPRSCMETVENLSKYLNRGFEENTEGWIKRNPRLARFPSYHLATDPHSGANLYLGIRAYNQIKPTLNVHGIHIGADKLTHIFFMGIVYYRKYHKVMSRIGDDLSFPEADRKAKRRVVDMGIRFEKSISGYWSKLLSYADVEANFQGFLLYQSFCHDPSPRLKRVDGNWQLVRPFDLGDYVSPHMDESYAGGLYNRLHWKKVEPILTKLCWKLNLDSVKDQREMYQTVPKSFSQRYVEERIAEGSAPNPYPHSLDKACKYVLRR